MASYTYSDHSEGCKCCRLKNGHDLPIPKDLSLDEIAELARKFSYSIFADWTKLNAILKRFEGVIQKRWAKKNFKQKREILLKACPGMPIDHRPDFVSFRNTTNRKLRRSVTQPSAAYLWPYVNLEDLSKQDLLPLYMHSRGRNLPHIFLELDLRSAHLGKGWKIADDDDDDDEGLPDYNGSMHFHPGSPRSYGQVVLDSPGIDEHGPEGFDAAALVNGDVYQNDTVHRQHPALGLLLLEIQQGIYRVLLACAKLILHDIEAQEFFLAPNAKITVPAHSVGPDQCSLMAHQLETPYRAPHTLNLDRIRTLLTSRRASAEDHLWQLQEDPGYFVNCFEEWAEYNENMISHGCPDCAQIVASSVVASALKHFLFWDHVSREFDLLTTPDEDHDIWVSLLWILDVIEAVLLKELANIRLSPYLRRNYDVLESLDDRGTRGKVRDDLSESEHRVMNLFTNLLDESLRELHTTNHLVQEIQYLLGTDAKAARLLDSWIAGRFSDLALVTELQFCIEILQPRFGKWRTSAFEDVLPIAIPNLMLLYIASGIDKGVKKLCRFRKNLIGNPSDGRLSYPVSKAYTKKNVDQMRHAEKLLDNFWEALRKGLEEEYEFSIDELVIERFLEPRTLYRTQEWTPPAVPALKSTALTDVSINTPHARNLWQASTKFESVKPKIKVKTRGIASSNTGDEDHGQASSGTVNEPSAIAVTVPKHTYKVLTALFPSSNAENHQRTEVAWFDFLHAMDTLGLQPEKLYGSVWIFRPKSVTLVEAKRSVQFHEPKEIRHGGKISAGMVRVFGKRLKRVYGWEGDMFESK